MVLGRFAGGRAAFYDTAADATDAALAVLRRPARPDRQRLPVRRSAAAGALLTYAALTGSGPAPGRPPRRLLGAGTSVADARRASSAGGWRSRRLAWTARGRWRWWGRTVTPAGPTARVALAGTAPGAVVVGG